MIQATVVRCLPIVGLLALMSPDVRGADAQPHGLSGLLDATGFQGGVIVHLGCGDGRVTAALAAPGNGLVHGLDTDAARVQTAREHLHQLGRYGRASVDSYDGQRLPYADNLVNLLVVSDSASVARAELLRVLCPGGAAIFTSDDGTEITDKMVKPRPENIDEWTHSLYDASGNPVARDEVVGPPGRVQWIAGPRYTRSHEHVPGIYCVVSSGGRIYYIQDDAEVGALRAPPDWQLVARDAFNGTLLWKQPIGQWFPHFVGWGSTPRHLQRRLVAVGDRVYVTLGLHAPLTAIDAATGQAVQTYDDTLGAEELIVHDGVLLTMVRSVTDQRIAELREWGEWTETQGLQQPDLDKRDTIERFVQRLRKIESSGQQSIHAIDASSGRTLWRTGPGGIDGYRELSLRAAADHALYQKGTQIVCVDLRTGDEQWSKSAAPLRLVSGEYVICAGNTAIEARSLATGEELWQQKPLLSSILDAFVVDDSLWIGGFKPYDTGRQHTGPSWGPYFAVQRDLRTGKVLMQVEPDNPGHHHRCYSNKATDRYILGGRRGTEFIDLQSGEVLWNSWVRGVCKYGVMPSNGLLYAPPHACGCYTMVKTTGFFALAARNLADAELPAAEPEPQRGPAYDATLDDAASPPADAWSTYRCDAARSGSTDMALPAALRIAWQTAVGGRLSALTVAEGKVFVADVDAHRVCALDSASGQPAWNAMAGARIDSPPTIAGGRALFGARDGYVYSVAVADGRLAWRLLAARNDRRVPADGQLESVAPCHGSVLLRDGALYATAGRSSYLDSGLDVLRIDPRTGTLLSRSAVFSPDRETGRQPEQYDANTMPGSRNDILSSDDEHVYLQESAFDGTRMVRHDGNPHLFAVTGMLDDAWSHRSYWIFGTKSSLATGCSSRARDLVYGRLLVFDDQTVYGYGRSTVHWSNQLEDGPYRLFAAPRQAGKAGWSVTLPVHVRAVVRAGHLLFVAGSPVEGGERSGMPRVSDTGMLLAASTADGSVQARIPLNSPPVFDGLAAAEGRLFLAQESGQVACLVGD
ncbi:MAG: PQQ-binding-like beta-propeller repeat protein [Pirellulaceae bacterium]|nr:PQQ-binding-like beta-propeller repeat protein [Pirellulaceae bacterium]